MLLNSRFVIFCSLASLLSGCAGLYERQAPAPVRGSQQGALARPVPAPVRPTPRVPDVPVPPPVVATQPLESFNPELKPIDIPPEPLEPAPLEPGSVPFDLLPAVPETGASEGFKELETPKSDNSEGLPATLPNAEPVLEPEIMTMTPFEPIEPLVSSSPAVGALVIAANENSRSGNVDVASSSIDRALKIEPRNPSLYYKLALLRLKQSKPQEAEDLAKKSALLAGKDRELKKHSWLLIAHARELRKDYKGAQLARSKANDF